MSDDLRIDVTVQTHARALAAEDQRPVLPAPGFEAEGVQFRADSLTELLRAATNPDGTPALEYAVILRGPRLTSKGNEHSTWRSTRVYADGTDVPPALAHLLLGRDTLVGALTDAITGALR